MQHWDLEDLDAFLAYLAMKSAVQSEALKETKPKAKPSKTSTKGRHPSAGR
jgi:hypothetical protein